MLNSVYPKTVFCMLHWPACLSPAPSLHTFANNNPKYLNSILLFKNVYMFSQMFVFYPQGHRNYRLWCIFGVICTLPLSLKFHFAQNVAIIWKHLYLEQPWMDLSTCVPVNNIILCGDLFSHSTAVYKKNVERDYG